MLFISTMFHQYRVGLSLLLILNKQQTTKTKRLRTARPLLGWTPPALTPSPCPTSGLVCLLSETVYSSRRSDFSVASARNACSWVMFVFHSSRCWSSVRSSVVRCCRRSSVVLSSVVRLVVAVGRLVVGCRLSVVVVVRQSLVVAGLVGRRSSVSLPGPSASELSRDSLPNSLPPRSPRLSSSASRATHCQPAFLLSASVDSSDKPFGVSHLRPLRFPPPGFRSSASASGSASLVHFPSSSLRLPSPPWLSPGFSRSPGSVLSSSPRRSRQTSLGPVPRHSLRSLGLPRGFPSLRVPLLGFVSALPSGSLLGPLGSSFLASLPHFSGRPVHPCRLPAIHDLPWVRSDSHFPGSCSSFPSSASGVFSSLREGASIPPLHVMHFLSLPHSFFAMTGFWLSPTL